MSGDAPASNRVIRIKPASRSRIPDVRELWQFRDVALMLALRDVRLRYRQTIVGVAWVLLQPLLTAGALTIVFGLVGGFSSEGENYFVFTVCGTVAWTVFASVFIRTASSVLTNTGLVSKVYFPRTLIPISSLGAVGLDALVGSALALVLLLVAGGVPPVAILTAPLWLAGLVLLALGPGLAAAGYSARYRDTQYTVPLVVQLLLYISPVGYSAATVKGDLRLFYDLNPIAVFIEGFRWAFLGTDVPSPARIAAASGVAVVSALLGIAVFSAQERLMADVI